ncbi:hypothetical protein NGC82_15750 [Enterococcus casseliflavus]|nr:hypothetical protein [Enterococcus casseliflavus]
MSKFGKNKSVTEAFGTREKTEEVLQPPIDKERLEKLERQMELLLERQKKLASEFMEEFENKLDISTYLKVINRKIERRDAMAYNIEPKFYNQK